MRNSYVYYIYRNIYICDLINFRSRYIQYNSHNFDEQMYRQIIFNASIYVLIHWQWCFALALSVIYLLLISKKKTICKKNPGESISWRNALKHLPKSNHLLSCLNWNYFVGNLCNFIWYGVQTLTLLCNYFYSEFFLSKKKIYISLKSKYFSPQCLIRFIEQWI